jgi:hypothetical protein
LNAGLGFFGHCAQQVFQFRDVPTGVVIHTVEYADGIGLFHLTVFDGVVNGAHVGGELVNAAAYGSVVAALLGAFGLLDEGVVLPHGRAG